MVSFPQFRDQGLDLTGTPDEIRAFVRKQKAAGADLIKIFASKSIRQGGGMTLSQEQLHAACDEATKQGLHTLLARVESPLAPDGTIYYTDFARGYLGHFDPSGRKLLKEWLSPGGSESEPYGIAITNDGEVWYSESGVKPNTLVRSDPKLESFSTKPIPSGGGVVRNMVATSDRRLYLACSGVNKIAVVI